MTTETKAKHTPGPWTVRENPNGTLGIDAYEPDGTPCQPCRVNGNAVLEPYATVTRANARLIAAAPELLAACKFMVSEDVTGGSEYWKGATHKALLAMEAAIAKATATERTEP